MKLKMKRTSQFAWKKNTYCQILKEKKKTITQPLLISQIYLYNCVIFEHGKYKKQNDTFLFLISDLDSMVVHRPKRYLFLQLVIQITLGKSFANLVLLYGDLRKTPLGTYS